MNALKGWCSWRVCMAGTIAAFIVAFVLLPSLPTGQLLANTDEEQEDADIDEQAVSLADSAVNEALAAAQRVPTVDVLTHVLPLPLPTKPDPAQKRPPCSPADQRAINGVCWWVLPRKPPCEGAYDYEDGCYLPVLP